MSALNETAAFTIANASKALGNGVGSVAWFKAKSWIRDIHRPFEYEGWFIMFGPF
jgi:hypothetical protein